MGVQLKEPQNESPILHSQERKRFKVNRAVIFAGWKQSPFHLGVLPLPAQLPRTPRPLLPRAQAVCVFLLRQPERTCPKYHRPSGQMPQLNLEPACQQEKASLYLPPDDPPSIGSILVSKKTCSNSRYTHLRVNTTHNSTINGSNVFFPAFPLHNSEVAKC